MTHLVSNTGCCQLPGLASNTLVRLLGFFTGIPSAGNINRTGVLCYGAIDCFAKDYVLGRVVRRKLTLALNDRFRTVMELTVHRIALQIAIKALFLIIKYTYWS